MPDHPRDEFVSTRWSLVIRAGTQPSTAADEALASLCEAYWYPLYSFLRRRGKSAAEAEDLTQSFFARLLEKRVLRQADPARGRFRSFLLAALKNFVANEWDRQKTVKAGGRVRILSLEFETAEGRFLLEPPTNETPEKVFDRQWGMTLLDRVLKRLDDVPAPLSDPALLPRLKPYILGGHGLPTYQDLGRELGLSEGAVKQHVKRLRERYIKAARAEIAETLGAADKIDDKMIDEEIRYLMSALRSGPTTISPLA